MSAIFKREFKSYFQNVIGWVFIAATMFFFGLYSYAYNMVNTYAKIDSVLQSITFLFLITVPILTMRAMAEERKNKTDQLIITAPVSVGKIVIGKYLAMAAVYTITVGIICIFPVILSRFGSIAYAETYVGIVGLWLYGLLCLAIGLFISSLTESIVLAAIISFAALFVAYMMGSISSMISASGILEKIMSALDITAGIEDFTGGTFSVSGLVYYVSAVILFLFLTCQSIQKRRWSGASTRKLQLSMFSGSLIAVGVVVCILVNVVVAQLPEAAKSIDITSNKVYTLTDDTLEYLDTLEEDITIYVWIKESSCDETLAKTLSRYEDASKHITVEYVDPNVSPTFYENYTDEAPTENSLFVVNGDTSKVVSYDDIYETEVDYTTYQYETTGYDGEGLITSAINYVTSTEQPIIYTLDGHGETSLDDSFTQAIEKMNIAIETISLLQEDAVPDDCELLVINGPTSDLNEDDAQKVIDYIDNGGKVLITLSYTTEDMPNFEGILESMGMGTVEGVVADSNSSYYYQYPYYLIPEILSTDLTSDAADGYIFMPTAIGLDYSTDDLSDNETITPLLTTSDDAISKVDVANATPYEKEDGDIEGPFNLGLWYQNTGDDGEGTGEAVVISSTITFSTDADEIVSGNNLTLFSSIVEEMVDTEGTNTVSIAVKDMSTSYLTVTQAVARAYGAIAIYLLPIALCVAGIIIWIKRRRN
ncbi:Gldg family protein [Eubacterium oxidoreducens]|uniref:ABC-2 type transport system permease protein n=1 Tax=Eubacterium oxidoreducens TaxID=1732 RepID=A0A1G6AFX6_EUBOX|nr:Gldg family protein [Eubacterium oxidoreducens]SDB07327.1 ABC-2 type transport system permease protein [Eubacterium oxidoreducens]